MSGELENLCAASGHLLSGGVNDRYTEIQPPNRVLSLPGARRPVLPGTGAQDIDLLLLVR